jgi:uncharacterized protein
MRKFLFLFFFPFVVLAQPAIPDHGGIWVHDDAHVLSSGTKAGLEQLLKAERDSTTNQIAILIVPSLDGYPIEEYTLKVAEQWKLGKKDTDNGVLFFISIADRRMRMEVGQGLEGVLTDAVSSRIDRNEVAPHFRQKDYDGGVQAATIAIIQAIKGEYVNNDPPQKRARRSRSPWTSLIVIIIVVIVAARRRKGGGGGVGGIGGVGGYWAAGSLLGGAGRGSGSSWGGGSDYGGGGSFGGGGSSDSW